MARTRSPPNSNTNSSIKLRKAAYVKVKELAPGSTGHNLVVQVVSVGATTEKPRFDGSVSKIVEVVVGDETGIVTLTARNDQINVLKQGSNVVIRNCNADFFNGFMRLNVTQWGKIVSHPDGIDSTPSAPKTIHKENDMSAIEYELVTVEESVEE